MCPNRVSFTSVKIPKIGTFKIVTITASSLVLHCSNAFKNADVLTNSVDPDQTAPS